jgi:type II secretory pathway component PulF
VKLSLREKQTFYRELARMLRSGRAFGNAVEMLAQDTRGSLRKFLQQLQTIAVRGDSVADAFAKLRPPVNDMELSILAASEHSGRLDRGCEQLAAYFGAMERARAVVLRRSLYPLFLLHFGIFTVALPKLFTGGGAADYFKQTIGTLVAIYLGGAVIGFIGFEILRMGRTVGAVDRFLRMVPVFRKIHLGFATARFCATYDAQLDAGVNVLDAFERAAQASGSALILKTARDRLPDLRAGAEVSSVLGSAFPREMSRAFRLAEGAGDLDEELKRLAEDYEQRAFRNVETLSEWLPKIIYCLVAIYLGYQIVSFYSGMVSGYEKILE